MPFCRKWGLSEKLIGVLLLAHITLVDLVWNILMSFICASVVNHDITKVMGQ
jgi:hypothetical protein